jgi:hypothetical protein
MLTKDVMERAFVVLRSRGPAWDDSKPLEAQSDWTAHAAFMDELFEHGFAASRAVGGGAPMRSLFYARPQHPRLSNALLRTRGQPTASS